MGQHVPAERQRERGGKKETSDTEPDTRVARPKGGHQKGEEMVPEQEEEGQKLQLEARSWVMQQPEEGNRMNGC